MCRHGVERHDGDWWNAGWVCPTTCGLGIALIVFDLFVRGPLRFLLVGPVIRLVNAIARHR
jgi:hypothetical protein